MSRIISVNTVLTKEQVDKLQEKYGITESLPLFLTLETSLAMKVEDVPQLVERVLERVLIEIKGQSKGFYGSSIVVANSQDLVVLFYLVGILKRWGIQVLSKDLKEFV